MTVITEKRLRFVFGTSWQVLKYDGEPVYREGIERLQRPIHCKNCPGKICCEKCGKKPEIGTRAVDIVGCRQDDLYLIEIKDFRRHEDENSMRLRSADLALDVAFKVKDTLAGLLGAMHRSDASPGLRKMVAPVLSRPPKVLFWLEQDIDPKHVHKQPDPTLFLQNKLGSSLSWLSRHVVVGNSKRLLTTLDLEVHHLSDRVYGLRILMEKQTSVSREDFCRVWSIPPQAAGEKLAQLCEQTILTHAWGKQDRYVAGPRWDWLQDG